MTKWTFISVIKATLNNQNHISKNCIGSVIYFFILIEVPFIYMERAGSMTCTATSNRGGGRTRLWPIRGQFYFHVTCKHFLIHVEMLLCESKQIKKIMQHCNSLSSFFVKQSKCSTSLKITLNLIARRLTIVDICSLYIKMYVHHWGTLFWGTLCNLQRKLNITVHDGCLSQTVPLWKCWQHIVTYLPRG